MDKLKAFFSWTTRRTFWELGIKDSKITDYISDLLTRFARTENLYRIRDVHGKPLESVVDLLIETDKRWSSDIERQRDLFKHIGDYILFMSSLFREYVEKGGYLSFYLEEGPRAYRSVWRFDQALFNPGAGLFWNLAHSFEYYVGGLNYMKKTLFKPIGGNDPFYQFAVQLEKLIR